MTTIGSTSKRLEGKVALVTGASRGIGAAIAKRFASEGAAVVITHSNSKEKAEGVANGIIAQGGKILVVQSDNSDAAQLKAAVDQTVKTFGGIDILVNNAGIGTMGPLDEFSIEDFDRIVAINLRAVFIGSQEAARHMKAGGRIISIGSCMADRVAMEGATAYSMTKAGVAGLTRGLARELAPKGITVNNIQPGPIDTEMNPATGPFAEKLKGMVALQRYGQVEEIAGLAAFLASSESSYITGESITADGGYNA